MNFTTKQEYLDFAASWKTDYAELTKKIRDTKQSYRETQRAVAQHAVAQHAVAQYAVTRRAVAWRAAYTRLTTPEEFKAYLAAYKAMNSLLEEVDLLRKQAHHALKIRVQSKEAAQAAYLSSRT